MLAIVNDSILYDDDAICLQSGIYRNLESEIITNKKTENIELVPNPANNYFEVLLNSSVEGICKLSVTNSINETILMDQFDYIKKNHKVRTDQFAPGVYYVSVKINSNNTVVKKLIIIR